MACNTGCARRPLRARRRFYRRPRPCFRLSHCARVLAEEPAAFEFTAQTADVEIVLTDAPGDVQAMGELHGFGLPGSRLTIEPRFEQAVVPTLRYVIEQKGWFTDLDARVSIRLPVADIRRITIHVQHGNVTFKDRTQNRVASAGQVQLDLHSATGKVQLDLARSAP